MALRFTISQKNKPQLIRNGYLFNRSQKLINSDESWICVNYYKTKCLARVKINSDRTEIMQENGEHNHAPDPAAIGAKEVVAELRERAGATQEAPHQVVANVTAGTSKHVFGFVCFSWLCEFSDPFNSQFKTNESGGWVSSGKSGSGAVPLPRGK